MGMVFVTAKVEDVAKWEEGFRTHGEHFKNMGVTGPIGMAVNDGNEVAACFAPTDVGKFMSRLDTPENVTAMEHDGVKPDTIKVYVMDRTFQP